MINIRRSVGTDGMVAYKQTDENEGAGIERNDALPFLQRNLHGLSAYK